MGKPDEKDIMRKKNPVAGNSRPIDTILGYPIIIASF